MYLAAFHSHTHHLTCNHHHTYASRSSEAISMTFNALPKPHSGFARSAALSLISAATASPFVQRRTYGSYPLQRCHFSGFSQTSRRAKLSIRRFLGSLPPDNSADNMQNLHKLRNL